MTISYPRVIEKAVCLRINPFVSTYDIDIENIPTYYILSEKQTISNVTLKSKLS